MVVLNIGISNLLKTEITELAKQHNIKKVILFGSRARGDYHRVSDIDIAITGGNVIQFSLDVEDKTNTLLKFDVINLDGAVQSELLSSIETEGIIIYEKI